MRVTRQRNYNVDGVSNIIPDSQAPQVAATDSELINHSTRSVPVRTRSVRSRLKKVSKNLDEDEAEPKVAEIAPKKTWNRVSEDESEGGTRRSDRENFGKGGDLAQKEKVEKLLEHKKVKNTSIDEHALNDLREDVLRSTSTSKNSKRQTVTVMDSLSNGSSKDVSQSLHESTSKIAVVQSGGDLFKLGLAAAQKPSAKPQPSKMTKAGLSSVSEESEFTEKSSASDEEAASHKVNMPQKAVNAASKTVPGIGVSVPITRGDKKSEASTSALQKPSERMVKKKKLDEMDALKNLLATMSPQQIANLIQGNGSGARISRKESAQQSDCNASDETESGDAAIKSKSSKQITASKMIKAPDPIKLACHTQTLSKVTTSSTIQVGQASNKRKQMDNDSEKEIQIKPVTEHNKKQRKISNSVSSKQHSYDAVNREMCDGIINNCSDGHAEADSHIGIGIGVGVGIRRSESSSTTVKGSVSSTVSHSVKVKQEKAYLPTLSNNNPKSGGEENRKQLLVRSKTPRLHDLQGEEKIVAEHAKLLMRSDLCTTNAFPESAEAESMARVCVIQAYLEKDVAEDEEDAQVQANNTGICKTVVAVKSSIRNELKVEARLVVVRIWKIDGSGLNPPANLQEEDPRIVQAVKDLITDDNFLLGDFEGRNVNFASEAMKQLVTSYFYTGPNAIGVHFKDLEVYKNVPDVMLALAACALLHCLEEYATGKYAPLYFSTSRRSKVSKTDPEEKLQSTRGFLMFYGSCLKCLSEMATDHPNAYARLRRATRQWVEEARRGQGLASSTSHQYIRKIKIYDSD